MHIAKPAAVVVAAVVAAALALAACGEISTAGAKRAAGVSTGAFSWLHPQPPPTGWTVVRIPTGSTLAYPASWKPQHGDPGTATAVLLRPDGAYLGYLNLTPLQGGETLSNWPSFRVDHNSNEGERAVRRLAAATGLRFLTGRGTCVEDAYTTTIGARFIEIACLVTGARTDFVIVGAAPPSRWTQAAPTLERAIEGVQT